MKSAPFIPSMVQAITVLTVLKMMTKAQTSCGGGMGRVMYERLPNHQLQGFDDDVVRDTAPPFAVLEKCQDLCLRDRTAANNIVRTCSSFDFQPGSRIASYSGGAPDYEESTCYLTREQAVPEGIGNLMLVPNSVHFTEVCITSNRPERECPNRRYVFERHPRKKLKLPTGDLKEMMAANRTECEDRCLNEFSFVCRSASFDASERKCFLSRFTRRTHPELLEDDANSDYLENTCLNAERRCDGLAVFIKEENKRLGGPFEVDSYTNLTLEECQSLCLRAEKYFCRSIEFDDMSKHCTLSEEDSVSQKDDLGISSSPTHHFYDLVCLDNHDFTSIAEERNCCVQLKSRHSHTQHTTLTETPPYTARGSEYPDNSVTSHLFSNGRRPDTAFQRYRNSRLGGEFHSEITGRTLSECLDECLRQTSFQCMSAVYSDRFRTCRLSRYNQKNGMRIIYDADYDYYENLMLGDGEGGPGGTRPGPDPMGQDSNWPGHGTRPPYYPPSSGGNDRYPPSSSGNGHRYPPPHSGDRIPPRYPTDRYPPGSGDRYPPGPGDRYPPGPGDRYPPGPVDRYPPAGGDRYPPSSSSGSRYPYDRYPPGDRYPYDRYPPSSGGRYPPPPTTGDRYPIGGGIYPPSSSGGDRYPIGGDRYPVGGGRYPPAPPVDHYPPSSSGGRYPVGPSRYPPDDRYPPKGDRYPPGDRYGGSSDNRFNSIDYFGGSDRYGGDRWYYTGRRPSFDAGYRPSYDSFRPSSHGDGYRPGPVAPDPGLRPGPSSHGHDGYRPPGGPEPGYRPPSSSGHDAGFRPGGVIVHDSFRPGVGGPDGYRPPPGAADGFRPPGGADGYRPPAGPDGYRPPGIGGHDGYRPGRPDGYRPGPGGPPPPPPPPGGHDVGYRPGPPLPPHAGYDGGYRGGRPNGYPGDFEPGYTSFGGVGPGRPFSSRCDEGDNFKQVGVRQRVRRQFVRRFTSATTLAQCQRECVEARDFICRSFNYRDPAPGPTGPYEAGGDRDNCELSDRDSRDLEINNPTFFDTTGNFDFYERSAGRDGGDGECLDVSQVCNEDGMEFTIRTPEGFVGRIYTYGFYDRCFFRGNGGTVNVLRISGPQGYPECGTQRYGDTMTNIVVVQFSDYVQTNKDKRFNLTCLFRGPGEAVVTSSYIGAGSGSPIPIEYLPAENSLSSKVRLMILYQGRPTTTIAVGDPLTFRLESQDGYNYVTDIFATNVIARDPYSGRSVQLIDRFGCPVDSYVFPELDKSREGDVLEARFNAFKIPESNFLVFEATVRTCRDGCQPAYCTSGTGRSEPSFGRKRRDLTAVSNDTAAENSTAVLDAALTADDGNATESNDTTVVYATPQQQEEDKEPPEFPEYVREMIEVFESREELQQEARRAVPLTETVCLTSGEYHGLLSAVMILLVLVLSGAVAAGLAYRRYGAVVRKNIAADRGSLHSSYPPTRTSGLSLFAGVQKPFSTPFGRAPPDCPSPAPGGMFEDPSEPIYTDPSLFERSRSLRSIAVSQKRRHSTEVNHM